MALFSEMLKSEVAITCGECEHFFDPSDKRSFISTATPPHPPLCPACAIETLRGREAWSVWNDCNGVFEVCMDRSDAVQKLAEYPTEAGCKVIPVRVYEEPEERWDMLEWIDRRDHQEAQERS